MVPFKSKSEKQARGCMRFSIRTLLLLITLLAVTLGVFVRPALRHIQAMQVVRDNDRSLSYDPVPLTDIDQPVRSRRYWRLVGWVMGVDAITTPKGWVDFRRYPLSLAELEKLSALTTPRRLVVDNSYANDKFVRRLRDWDSLGTVSLSNTEVTDAVFGELAEIPQLKFVKLLHTQVTAEAVKRFTDKHPGIDVQWSPRSAKEDAETIRKLAVDDDFAIEFRGEVVFVTVQKTHQIDLSLLAALNANVTLQLFALRREQGLFQPDVLSQLDSVKSLQLYGGGVSRNMAWLGKLPSLQRLTVSQLGAFQVPRIKSLRELSLANMPFSNDDLVRLVENNPQLTSLKIDSESLNSFESLGLLKELRKLDLTGTSIDDVAIRGFATLKNLEEIRAGFTWVSEPDLRTQVLQMPSLKSVHFRNIRMTRSEFLEATNSLKNETVD